MLMPESLFESLIVPDSYYVWPPVYHIEQLLTVRDDATLKCIRSGASGELNFDNVFWG